MKSLSYSLQGKPIDEKVVASFEQKIGTGLPADYRRYLIRDSGGFLDPEHYCIDVSSRGMGNRKVIDVVVLYTFDHIGPQGVNLVAELEENRDEIPEELLAIGADDFGCLFLIGIAADEMHGKIFYFDRLQTETDGQLYLLADSFEEFLGMIVSESEVKHLF